MPRERSFVAACRRAAIRRRVAAASFAVLILASAGAAQAQDIVYTFSGVISVLDSATAGPGVDPLGMDGASVLLMCVIDSSTAPSFTGPNGDGTFAFYNAGTATLAVTGSVGGAADGTYTDTPCSVRVDDFPVGSVYGGDKLSITSTWDLGLPFPDVFQVPFAELGGATFTSIDLQPFDATDVVSFIGVNFMGSSDTFWFAENTGIAMGLALGAGSALEPAARISALIEAVEGLTGLGNGQSRFLTVKLDNALRHLDQGRERAAVAELSNFVWKLKLLMRLGRLTPAEGQPLVDEASAIVAQLLAGG